MNESNKTYKAVKIAEDFFSIEEENVRSFLVVGKNRAMLVDTGWGTGNIREFAETLTDLPIFVVITHADLDHVLGNHYFNEVYMHPAEFAHYRQSQKYHASIKLLPLWEGDIIDLGTRKFEIIHIPGHTQGSIVFLDRKNKILIGGDSIQPGPIYMFEAHRSMEAFVFSMEKLLAMGDIFDTVISSHGNLKESADIVPALIQGAKQYLAGKAKGTAPAEDIDCLLVDCGRVKFYCNK